MYKKLANGPHRAAVSRVFLKSEYAQFLLNVVKKLPNGEELAQHPKIRGMISNVMWDFMASSEPNISDTFLSELGEILSSRILNYPKEFGCL